MNNKSICIIAPSLQAGGIERALTILSSYFVKREYKVIYIACRSGNHFYTLDPVVKYIEPEFKHNTSPLNKAFSYFNTILFVRRQIKLHQPDTILSFGDIINPIALLANFRLNYPIYISDRISPKQKLSVTKRVIKRITYPLATGIIAQTRQAADYKYKVFGNKINLKIIPNALRDITVFNIEKQNWVVGIGRLSYEKGFDRLLEAFSKIKDHKEWSLVLAGAGPEMKRLKKQADVFGIIESVQFLGLVKDIDKLLAQSKIFVIPSRSEGFPNALCEAMASPLPCISFDSIPTENLITNGKDGIIVNNGDIETLSHKIEELMDNIEMRESLANNAKSIRNRLDKEKIGDEFLNFIFSHEK